MPMPTIKSESMLKLLDEIISATGDTIKAIGEKTGISPNTLYNMQRREVESRVKYTTASKLASTYGFKIKIDQLNDDIVIAKIANNYQLSKKSTEDKPFDDDFEVHEMEMPEELKRFLNENENSMEKVFELVAMASKFGIKDSNDLREAVINWLDNEIEKQKTSAPKEKNTKENSYRIGKGTSNV